VIDHRAVVEFARRAKLVSLIDNTFASPVNFQPAEIGYDLSLHSATKYLNGHSDVVAGAVIGKAELVDQVRRRLNHLGGTLDPEACYLLYRGLRTLVLRVERQNENALQLARFLHDHEAVARVHYPGLPSHPHHERAASLFRGFGGMLSFELAGGPAAVARFLAAVRLAVVGPSLGGVETLLTQPARTSHAALSPAQRAAMGISDDLIRMSVGIEAVADLSADLQQALAAAAGTAAGTAAAASSRGAGRAR
jgi:cystathionine beta-lyase/cystathionine gamma-synthase